MVGKPSDLDVKQFKIGVKEMWCGKVKWIQLAQNMVQWRALMNMIITFESVKMAEHQLPKKNAGPCSLCTKILSFAQRKYIFEMRFQKFCGRLSSLPSYIVNMVSF